MILIIFRYVVTKDDIDKIEQIKQKLEKYKELLEQTVENNSASTKDTHSNDTQHSDDKENHRYSKT